MCTDQIILSFKQGKSGNFVAWLFRAVLLATVISSVFILTGCQGYEWQVQPDGIHSVKHVCYKDKGCVVQDCVTHYEAVEKGAAGAE